jgi:hypothetical protein
MFIDSLPAGGALHSNASSSHCCALHAQYRHPRGVVGVAVVEPVDDLVLVVDCMLALVVVGVALLVVVVVVVLPLVLLVVVVVVVAVVLVVVLPAVVVLLVVVVVDFEVGVGTLSAVLRSTPPHKN